MDSSKINQSQLNYECTAGKATLNLYTGRLMFETLDLSIGVNNYQISISHIYNAFETQNSLYNRMGKGWKLNIEQYLYPEKDEYVYIDGIGVRHQFKKLRENEYYDTSGSNLVLKIFAQPEIIDSIGNTMIFSSNRVIKTISGFNSSIRKKYNYDFSGKLSTLYDERKPGNRIEFSYDQKTGLLNKIHCTKDYLEIESIFYYYDINQNLIRITKTVNGVVKQLALYRYNSNRLYTAFSMEDYSALEFVYSLDKVTTVKTGILSYNTSTTLEEKSNYLKDGVISGDQLFMGEKEKTNYYVINGNINTLNVNMKSENVIEYADYKTIITNHKQVQIVYYLNEKGYTTSIFEANNKDLNDLRYLEKTPGIQMIGNGSDLGKINTYRGHVLTTDMILTNSDIFSQCFSKIQEYRKNKCPDYIYYVCSFWLMLEQSVTNSKIEFKINSKNAVESKIIDFDKSAVSSWQLISIPLMIQNENINSIQMKFLENNKNKYVTIADMRINYTTSNVFYLTNGEIKDPLDKIVKVNYVNSLTSTQEEKQIDENFYLSESDIRSTYLSYFKENGNTANGNCFILTCCDGTYKASVHSVSFYADINIYHIGFHSDDYGTNTRAQYYLEIESPDGKLSTKGITHFIKNKVFNHKTCDCLHQITEAKKDGKNPIKSCKELFIDLKGKILFEKNEYGIEMVYEYDIEGNLNKKYLQHSETDEKIISMSQTNQWSTHDQDYFNENQTFYSNPTGLIEKTSFNGITDESNQALITNYQYNLFKDQCTSIENNLNGKNVMRYDQQNRLIEVSPYNWDEPNRYGFKFQYNNFNEPNKYYAIYRNGSLIAQDLLVEKIVNYSSNTVLTKEYRNIEQPDYSKVYLDKYDRISKIEEESKVTTFKRQTITESQMASEVEEMFDPYDHKTHLYKYDESNNITSYSVKDTNGSNVIAYRLVSENTTLCDISTAFKIMQIHSILEHTEDKLIEPRIKSLTQNFNTNLSQLSMDEIKTNYDYDVLGRIKKVNHRVPDGFTYSNIIKEYGYKKNTILIENSKTQITNAIVQDTIYDFNYAYDSRGNIKKTTWSKTRGSNTKTSIREYTYDKANRITSEIGNNGYLSKNYQYNLDGSLDKEMIGTNLKQYSYYKGQLNRINYLNESSSFEYDNLGNCIKYKKDTIEENLLSFERGNLLKRMEKSGEVTNYAYNNQKIRYKKELSNGKIVNYYLDGDKILREDLGDGNYLTYLYDSSGIIGFRRSNRRYNYLYVKDASGNIIGILDNDKEVAHYEYDIWGNSTITEQEDGVGDINPFRWKSQYYDQESGFYYINNRYYSPLTKQYLSGLLPETLFEDMTEIYGINRYILTIDNPINLMYNEHTHETNNKLIWDPPKLSSWDKFQRWMNGALEWYNGISWWQKMFVGTGLFLAGLALTVATGGVAIPFIIKFGIGLMVGTSIGTGINLAMGADFGDALLDGFADSMLWSGLFALASGAIRASRYTYAYTMKNADIMTKLFTHNKHATTVMLGKWDGGGSSGYIAQAKAGGHTYFSMPSRAFKNLSVRFGGDIGMFEINKAFLRQNLHKVFLFSHSIANATGFFRLELLFLGILG